MRKSQQMTREDLTISQNPNLSLGETQESSFYYFCQKLNDYSTIFFQFRGVASFRELRDTETDSTFYKMPYFFSVFRWSLENNPAHCETYANQFVSLQGTE